MKVHNYVQAQNIEHKASGLKDLSCLTLSIGVVSELPDNSSDTRTLIERADKALYEVKQNGRNQARVFVDYDHVDAL